MKCIPHIHQMDLWGIFCFFLFRFLLTFANEPKDNPDGYGDNQYY